jgi:hypothetical protein
MFVANRRRGRLSSYRYPFGLLLLPALQPVLDGAGWGWEASLSLSMPWCQPFFRLSATFMMRCRSVSNFVEAEMPGHEAEGLGFALVHLQAVSTTSPLGPLAAGPTTVAARGQRRCWPDTFLPPAFRKVSRYPVLT